LYLIEYGFTINDIEILENEYEIRDYNLLLNELIKIKQEKKKYDNKKKEMERYINMIDMCDSVLHGMAGTYSRKGYGIYKRWRNKIINKLNKMIGRKEKTVWDKMKRKSNKI